MYFKMLTSTIIERYKGYGKLKVLVIYIHLSIFIFYKNGPNITNTRSDITLILYFF